MKIHQAYKIRLVHKTYTNKQMSAQGFVYSIEPSGFGYRVIMLNEFTDERRSYWRPTRDWAFHKMSKLIGEKIASGKYDSDWYYRNGKHIDGEGNYLTLVNSDQAEWLREVVSLTIEEPKC